MRICHINYLCIILCFCLLHLPEKIRAQNDSSQRSSQHTSAAELFGPDEVLEIVLKGNVRAVINDRTTKPKYRPIELVYRTNDGNEVSLPVEAKTRGHFRKAAQNCFYPPLLIKFPKKGPHDSSIFRDQSKLKLVMPCKGDEFVVREWLVYKLYNLVTPKSFLARLVRVTIETGKNKKSTPFYGIFLEEERQLAKRNNLVSVETKLLRPEQTIPDAFLTMAVFEYLIANTDWSVQYLQNIKLLAPDSLSIPLTVPYDFDMAGIVNSPYAKPAEELMMSSVRERRFRGYCVQDLKIFDEIIKHFNQLKDTIYASYTNCKLLDEKYLVNTLGFLDEFYATINNPVALEKAFRYPCDKNGTGNVVIRGLKEEEE